MCKLPFFIPSSKSARSSRLTVAAFLVCAVASFSSTADAETLVVKVSGFQEKAGNLQVMVWKDSAGFPTQPERAVARKVVRVTGARTEVTLNDLAKGVYAVAAFQDINSNEKLDRSLLGWPTEPVGASNGASGLFGPPKFKDAAFELKQPMQVIEVRLK